MALLTIGLLPTSGHLIASTLFFRGPDLNDSAIVASVPAAWLKPLPDGYEIPLWRWVVLPATTIMLKRNAGVWVNGTLDLLPESLRFTQTRLTKAKPPETWALPLTDISAVDVENGFASEKIEVRRAGRSIKLMAVRSAEFVALLRQATFSQ